MAIKYTDSFDIFLDVSFYLCNKLGAEINIGLIPTLATNRLNWMVNNWAEIYQNFKNIAKGNQILESSLVDFDRAIQSVILGNKNNELENKNSYKKFYPFLESILISSIALTPDEQIFLDKEIERVNNLNIDDFRNMVSFLKIAECNYASQIGLNDPVAAAYKGIAVGAKRKNASVDDIIFLEGITQTIEIIEGIIYDLMQQQNKAPNLLKFSNNNITSDSQVSFLDIYRSFINVPFEISLESMAQKYLGSQDLWYELVTVNNLKPPYIDEIGEKFPLLAPASSNSVIIRDTRKVDIPVGTSIGIGSFRYKEETRIIERTIENEDGTIVLFLSGKQDLNKFLTSDQAFVKIYLPGTVRPGKFVKIPLVNNSPLAKQIITPKADELRRLDRALLSFGVDIKRDETTNDFVVDANGNFQLAYGLDNVRQTVLYALRTTQNELPFHPDYGVNTGIGERFFGTVDEALVFGDVLRNTLLRDQRFLDVQIAALSTTGTSISLSLLVIIAGSDQPIPLSFVS